MLRDSNRDAYRAWMWYQDNKDEFSAEIYGPPILNCSVTNMKLVNAIESLIANANFTCQNSGDYDKFIHKVFGKPSDGGLGLANVSIKDFSRSPHPTLQSWERKYSKELVSLLL